MSLGPWMGALRGVRQVWSSLLLAPYVTWLGLTVSARVVVGTRAISPGCERGLALMADVCCWPGAEMWVAAILLIWRWYQISGRWGFPCSARLVFSLLWKPSLGMMKRRHARWRGRIRLESGGPIYTELQLDKGLQSLIGWFNPFRPWTNESEGEIKEVTLSWLTTNW